MEQLLPAIAATLCAMLAGSMLGRYRARRRIHELVWAVTFGAFGVAAATELYAGLAGWSPWTARLYYLAGASLSVGFLALGTLFLLVPRPLALAALFVVAVQSAFMTFLVLRAPVDPVGIELAGWSALTRDGSLRALALTINVLGTLVVVLGTFGSAYALWGARQGRRAAGVFLIGLGTLTVATGGSLTRFGHEYLYGPMALGLLIIFTGYRLATSPRPARADGPPSEAPADRSTAGRPATPGVDATIPLERAGGEAWRSPSKS